MDRRTQLLALLAALSVCVFAALLLRGLTTPHDFWFDETFSIVVSALPWPDFAHEIAQDIHPPLYSFALRAVQALLGQSETAIRLLSTLAVCTGLAALTAALWPVSRPAALVALALLSVAGPVAFFALEARAYAFLFCLSAITPVLWVYRRHRAFYFACLLLGLTHFFGTLLALVLLALDAAARLAQKAPPWPPVAIGALVAIWPLALFAIRTARGLEMSSWITTTPLGVPAEAAAGLSPVTRFLARTQGLAGIEALLVGTVLALSALWLVRRWSDLGETARRLTLVAGASLVGVIFGVIVLSAITPIASPRNFICLLPAAAILTGLALGDFLSRASPVSAALLAIPLIAYLAASAQDASRWMAERIAPRENYSWAFRTATDLVPEGEPIHLLIDEYFNVNHEMAEQILAFHTPDGVATRALFRTETTSLSTGDVVLYAHARMAPPGPGQRIGTTPAFVADLREIGREVELRPAPQSLYPNTGVALITR